MAARLAAMRQSFPAVFGLLLWTSLAHADALGNLHACLASMSAHSPVEAVTTITVLTRSGKPNKESRKDKGAEAHRSEITLRVAASPAGVSVTAPPELLARLRGGTQAVEAESSAFDAALREARFDNIEALLNAAPSLIEDLAGATVVRQSSVELDGRPATLLLLKVRPSLSEEDRKHIKAVEAEMSVWIGADGCPLALEATTDVKAKFLIFTAKGHFVTHRVYSRLGDRLIVTSERNESESAGIGQHDTETVTIVLQPRSPESPPSPSP